MKKITISVLAASLLMALPSVAAVVTRDVVKETLSREIKIDETATHTAKDLSLAQTALSRIAKINVESAGLNKTLSTNLGEIKVVNIAKAIDQSARVMADSTKISNEQDAKAIEILKTIEASNQAYAEGLSLVSAKISDINSEGGKAVAKILVMGRETALGNLDVKQSESYTKMMRAMTEALRQGQAKTSEDALDKGLVQMGMDKAQKIKELVSCVNLLVLILNQ
jgi:hypothetical protein